MKYTGYVYCIQNKINGKKYIGQTSNEKGYNSRWNYHKWALKHNEHENKNLQNDYNVFGLEAFEFTLLHEFQANTLENLLKTLDNMEKYYIKSWNLLDENFGYNISRRGRNIRNDKKTQCNKGKKYKLKKQILCIETGEIFDTSQDVIDKKFPGKSSSMIRLNLIGKKENAYDYHFVYIEREKK